MCCWSHLAKIGNGKARQATISKIWRSRVRRWYAGADAFVVGLVSALFLDIFFLMSTSDMLSPLSAAFAHAGDRHVNLVALYKTCFSVTDAMC